MQTLVDRLLAPHRRPHVVGDVNIHEVCERVRSLILAEANPKLVPERIRQAFRSGRAIDLTGEWLYTPTPPRELEAAALVRGKFDACPWQPTPVPSRRGAGDDRLHDRSGDFYYRRAFTLPDTWPKGDGMLVIGAVDDFDATYLNGTQIGATGVETPQHWQAPRYYRFPAGLLRKGQPNVLLIISDDLRDTVDRKRARLMLTGVFQHLLALEFVY